MRVTNRMSFDQAQAQMMAARDRAIKAQQQVTSGMRVDHPGDDPAAAGVMVSQGIAIQRLNTIDKTTSSAQGEVQTADGALQNVSTLLSRAQQLAVQLGNDTYSAAERSAGAQEINSISSQIVQLMNTQVAGRYIFGGAKDSAPPFDASGNYLGDSNVRQIEIAPGLQTSEAASAGLPGSGGERIAALNPASIITGGVVPRSRETTVTSAWRSLSRPSTSWAIR